MALRKNGNQPPTLDQLRSQHSELTSRAGAVTGQLARLDPVADWELASRALAEQAALERAVVALELRIEAAAVAERAAGVEAQDAARQAAAVAAHKRVDDAARAVCDALQRLQAGELAELWAARAQLVDMPNPAASPAFGVSAAVAGALDAWQRLAPTWLGLPEPEPAAVVAVKEARAAVKRAEARLDDLRALKRQVKHGAAQPDDSALVNAAQGVQGCRRRLLRLEHPEIVDEAEIIPKTVRGLENELDGWLGIFWENQRRAAFQAQQQAQAQQSPVMA